ncbi:Structural maintenance of chromosomes protein 2 [Psilocybe cubensis]|uniref:Structural maintenance of chromosomes protein n=2 Tax=Psilocybe cubensis TaxID=181762 RepID=A0A8H8CG84_PSICU|nr:Structural maintenance of chromosomes protein 2 [Psilocybe cubensis]KAH9475267.1 Structural maintenance of chromosomes protein 2 [Psilocybe cubensis]
MRIEELVIDGFKSYPVRTAITGWDPSFNAITGLNGSGKSNILDAICFVLGITNMSQMRASNQVDLIYKRGQAGVVKASVSIIFDNSDKDNSPVGFQDQKQITVTRQIALPNVSKYFLNGHKSQQATIQSLFQSVQLNINNPNFVIMQGRITKVLNMRPQEILGMVEEAAGTRMFEERKDKAKKTMGKKEKRVEELQNILDEEITPKLEKLRAEKRSYIAYQKSVSELERIGRKLRAYEWTDGQKKLAKYEADILAANKKQDDIKTQKMKALKAITAAEKEMAGVTKRRDAEMSKGGKLKKLQDEVTEQGKKVAKIRAQAEIKLETIKEEEKKVVTLDAQLKEANAIYAKKKKEVEKVSSQFTKIKDKHTEFETKLASDEELLQTLLTGLSSSNAKNKGGGYMGQLADAKARIAQAASEEQQNKVKLSMNEKELANLEKKMQAFAKEAGDNMKKLENVQAAVEGLEGKIKNCGWGAEQDRELERQLREARDLCKNLAEQRERVKSRIPRLNFDYEDPTPNFDRRKVKGVAAQLITLPEEHYNKATALEIAGGGKLFNVVIEDEKVGKDLIKNGRLKKRVTFIPLNKINARTLANQELQAATRLAPGKVRTALSLVGYEEEVSKAIAYIFSDTLVCDDPNTAKEVTFKIGVKSVTLDGDVYDPSGTLSGGSAPSSTQTLIQVQELIGVENKFREAQHRLQTLMQEEQRTQNARNNWKGLTRDLEIKQHELKLLQEQVGGSNASLIAGEVEKVKGIIDNLRQALQSAKDRQQEAKEECKKLERDMDEFKNNKDGKIEELKVNIAAQKTALQKNSVIVKTQQKELQAANMELEQLENDISGEKEQLEEARAGIEALHQELDKLVNQVASSEAEHAKAEERLQEEMATLSRFDEELKALDRDIKKHKEQITQADLDTQQLDHDIQGYMTEKNKVAHAISKLESTNEWIETDKDQFGKEGTQYDFKSIDLLGLRQKAEELQAMHDGLKKKVNTKVMNMIDSVEKKETDLKKNMAIVNEDKTKIEETIEELDRYKRDALQKTWEKVSKDFGDIFAELLPGNFAKLQPPDGQDLMDGLEVKVQLGTVWKQSLTELSGGQRSLIALSLIMALLQFKPAPMYILDEIDAALDLSHTQHIGQLFRTRFKGSQFIVVSLKEGLFTNANVLFRARFRDGTSIVERTAQRSTSALYANGNGNGEDDENQNPRRARRIAGS